MPVAFWHNFERRVYSAIKTEIQCGDLPVVPNHRLRWHPRYFSRDRNARIQFDISIEFFFGGAKEPFLIWIWECKNYKGIVPVKPFETFHDELSQIGADNTKGTIIASSGLFSASARKYAIQNKIGLASLKEPDEKKFLHDNQLDGDDVKINHDQHGFFPQIVPTESPGMIVAAGLLVVGLVALGVANNGYPQPDPKWDKRQEVIRQLREGVYKGMLLRKMISSHFQNAAALQVVLDSLRVQLDTCEIRR